MRQWLINRFAYKIQSYVDEKINENMYISNSEYEAISLILKDKYQKMRQLELYKIEEKTNFVKQIRAAQIQNNLHEITINSLKFKLKMQEKKS